MIKTKIIHGKVDILCIAGLPEDAEFEGYPSPNSIEFLDRNYKSYYIEIEEDSNWQPVNWLDKVSEEDAEELVEDMSYADMFGEQIFKYKNYLDNSFFMDRAKESLLLLVESEVKIKNKHDYFGHRPDYSQTYMPVKEMDEIDDEWLKEESKVWKNIYLLKKIK